MSYPDRLRLPLVFDAAGLAAELAGVPASEWVRHFVRDNYEGDWIVAALRAQAGVTHPVQKIFSHPTCRSYVDTPMLEVLPRFREALAKFECPLLCVRLMRLGPGSRIKEHDDHDLDFEHGAVRMHIPVTTNPGVGFYLNGTRVQMEAGSCWYLRLSDPHSVVNEGAEERVHLVIDALVDDWLAARFEAAARR